MVNDMELKEILSKVGLDERFIFMANEMAWHVGQFIDPAKDTRFGIIPKEKLLTPEEDLFFLRNYPLKASEDKAVKLDEAAKAKAIAEIQAKSLDPKGNPDIDAYLGVPGSKTNLIISKIPKLKSFWTPEDIRAGKTTITTKLMITPLNTLTVRYSIPEDINAKITFLPFRYENRKGTVITFNDEKKARFSSLELIYAFIEERKKGKIGRVDTLVKFYPEIKNIIAEDIAKEPSRVKPETEKIVVKKTEEPVKTEEPKKKEEPTKQVRKISLKGKQPSQEEQK
jgi:hypothetical protein